MRSTNIGYFEDLLNELRLEVSKKTPPRRALDSDHKKAANQVFHDFQSENVRVPPYICDFQQKTKCKGTHLHFVTVNHEKLDLQLFCGLNQMPVWDMLSEALLDVRNASDRHKM